MRFKPFLALLLGVAHCLALTGCEESEVLGPAELLPQASLQAPSGPARDTVRIDITSSSLTGDDALAAAIAGIDDRLRSTGSLMRGHQAVGKDGNEKIRRLRETRQLLSELRRERARTKKAGSTMSSSIIDTSTVRRATSGQSYPWIHSSAVHASLRQVEASTDYLLPSSCQASYGLPKPVCLPGSLRTEFDVLVEVGLTPGDGERVVDDQFTASHNPDRYGETSFWDVFNVWVPQRSRQSWALRTLARTNWGLYGPTEYKQDQDYDQVSYVTSDPTGGGPGGGGLEPLDCSWEYWVIRLMPEGKLLYAGWVYVCE